MKRLITRVRSSEEAKSLLRGSAATFAMKMLGELATFGTSIMFARYLGAGSVVSLAARQQAT
jgi:hypothetical protein